MAKIRFVGQCCVSDAALARHRAYAHGLGLPEIGSRPVPPFLAVVGGGPDVRNHLETLRDWDGEIWAINGAWGYLDSLGIGSTFYTIDPNEGVLGCIGGVRRAVLGDTVRPDVFGAIPDVELVRLGKAPDDPILPGTTSASTAITVALERGHTRASFFGCESSYGAGTHAYRDDRAHTNLIDVRCGGEIYETSPQMLMQAEEMAEIARAAPAFVDIRGQGFLPALVRHGDYDVIAVSRDLAKQLEAT